MALLLSFVEDFGLPKSASVSFGRGLKLGRTATSFAWLPGRIAKCRESVEESAKLRPLRQVSSRVLLVRSWKPILQCAIHILDGSWVVTLIFALT
jgi:hypothetical protein